VVVDCTPQSFGHSPHSNRRGCCGALVGRSCDEPRIRGRVTRRAS
jgi:hypothetical protein